MLPGIAEPRTGLSMGESTERMVKTWGISRADQDQLALESHQKAAAAYAADFYADLVHPYLGLSQDNNIRSDIRIDQLTTLRPAFDHSAGGTLTAGNSSPPTDGASAVLLASKEWARQRNLPVLAYLTYGKLAAVNFVYQQEGLLMAPAFAGQLLCTLKAWDDARFCHEKLALSVTLGTIDRSKLNVKGGSIAIGHAFAASGARMGATLAKIPDEGRAKRRPISIFSADGMGVTALLER